MNNYERIANSIALWLKPHAMDLLKQQKPIQTINESLRNSTGLKKFINFFGINLTNYNVVDELGFLVDPLLRRVGNTMIIENLQKFTTEENVYSIVNEILDSAITESSTKTDNKINVFGIQLSLQDLQELKEVINRS